MNLPADRIETDALRAFAEAFDGRPEFYGLAPGRVELLGNHTDYNGGLVLAAAIDRRTIVVGRERPGRTGAIASANLGGVDRVVLDDLRTDDPASAPRGDEGSWPRYVRGVAWALQSRSGPLLKGYQAAMAGDVPLGAGLSSSASLQASLAWFLIAAGSVPGVEAEGMDDAARMALADTLRLSENRFVGVGSGLLDQFSSLIGREGHALMLDCSTLAYERVPMGDPAPAIVVCDSRTSRKLAEGQYNRRVEECNRVVGFFRDRRGDAVGSLRDIGLEDLESHWDDLDPIGRRRARHVLMENDRVRRGVEALRRGDLPEFGRLISASHASSRDDFENSSEALDALVESAESAPGFLGGKLSGAGWAGCTVNLVEAHRADDFSAAVSDSYRRRTGLDPKIHVCRAAEGATGGRLQR